MGTGPTLVMLLAHLGELEEEHEGLQQERRMGTKARDDALSEHTKAESALEKVEESLAALAKDLEGARQTLEEEATATALRETIEKGVVEAEMNLLTQEDSVVKWEETGKQAQVQSAEALIKRKEGEQGVQVVQKAMWAEKAELRVLTRQEKALDEQVADQEKRASAGRQINLTIYSLTACGWCSCSLRRSTQAWTS